MTSRWREVFDLSIESVLADHNGFVMCALWRIIISLYKDTSCETLVLCKWEFACWTKQERGKENSRHETVTGGS